MYGFRCGKFAADALNRSSMAQGTNPAGMSEVSHGAPRGAAGCKRRMLVE